MDNEQLNEQNFTPQQEAQIENEVKTACQETTPPMPKPNNNLALAIFTTVCCCLPFGIVAITKASKVDSLYATGHYQEAIAEAETAKKYSTYGIVLGFILGAVYTILQFFLAYSKMH